MRCNLLGHSYGDEEARTSSDDGEAGDIEVHKRVQVCERCDHEKVVSENKSVRVSQDAVDDEADVTEPAAADGGTNDGNLAHGYDYDTNDAIILGEDDYPGEGDDADDETDTEADEVEDSTTGTTVQPENGVAFIDSGPGTTEPESDATESTEDTPAEPSDDEFGTPTTSGGATIITDGPGSTAESDEEVATDDGVTTSAPEPTDEAEADVPDEATVVSGGGDAIVWSGDTSSSDAAQTHASTDDSADDDETPQSRRERLRSRQSSRESSRLIREGGRDVTCPDCSFRKNQYEANMVAGDACPECRGAYLDWVENTE